MSRLDLEDRMNHSTVTGSAVGGSQNTSFSLPRVNERDLIRVISAVQSNGTMLDKGSLDVGLSGEKNVMPFKPFGKSNMVSFPEAKIELFRQRYDLIRQRIQRNETHLHETPMGNMWGKYRLIDSIVSLKGREYEDFVVFGMLSQHEEGVYYLEDKESNVRLNLGDVHLGSIDDFGIITESAFVLVQGQLSDNIFNVKKINLPPYEQRRATMSVYPDMNFFGRTNFGLDKTALKAIESIDDNGAFLFLSDVWLDDQETIAALRRLFNGFSTSKLPLAFVLSGNFCSTPYVAGSGASSKYKGLASLICEFPELSRKCHFIFVPGPNDPWNMGALPYPPLSTYLVEKIKTRVPKSTFSANPTRIQFCSQEIVVFREDLVKKMRRNCVVWPKSSDTLFEENVKELVVKTIISQSHLSPFPLRVEPVLWEYDHSLRLYPNPDLPSTRLNTSLPSSISRLPTLSTSILNLGYGSALLLLTLIQDSQLEYQVCDIESQNQVFQAFSIVSGEL
ncbi:DNA polymerase epsilon subunit 2 [Zancudomyces culisetae]|uniref:DNA polymerase epsilon subunit B n=1 Tax=Zancudomyces culisetae TaxID=1213189 RepID=A0A1R1PWH4_ZANCU|nr:DNA polymerase epsilon subunit 2 [Zancudomyces culisetae]|eukprot:OMH85263.1 DNA polymerase epsilon subunit 2 [Zancudomyces culisetae]